MFETNQQKPAGLKRIVVVGSINMDLVFRSARMPGPGETLIGASFQTAPVIHSADAVLVQLEIPYETVAAAIRIARSAGVRIVLDPAPAPPGGLPEVFFEVDVLSPNQSEAALLTGIEVQDLDTARRAAAILQERGARRVVMKLGARGALALDDRGEAHHVPAFPASVVDTTAAGDAFTAALAIGLAEGMPLIEAVRFGCAAGAQAVSRPGAQAAMPWREEVGRM